VEVRLVLVLLCCDVGSQDLYEMPSSKLPSVRSNPRSDSYACYIRVIRPLLRTYEHGFNNRRARGFCQCFQAVPNLRLILSGLSLFLFLSLLFSVSAVVFFLFSIAPPSSSPSFRHRRRRNTLRRHHQVLRFDRYRRHCEFYDFYRSAIPSSC
jgi:hypothetical protein